jgi:LytR cell envelope-related transcriptional attenuator
MTFPRVRAMIFVAVLFVTAGVVVLTAVNRDTQVHPPEQSCGPNQLRVNIEVPRQDQVTLNVFNGTDRTGLAEQIAGELGNRGFNASAKEGVPEGGPYDLAGYIVYGPEAVGAGWLVRAYFLPEEYEPRFVRERTGAEVDLILGQEFQQLTTTTEVNQRIADLGPPEAPDGTCAA